MDKFITVQEVIEALQYGCRACVEDADRALPALRKRWVAQFVLHEEHRMLRIYNYKTARRHEYVVINMETNPGSPDFRFVCSEYLGGGEIDREITRIAMTQALLGIEMFSLLKTPQKDEEDDQEFEEDVSFLQTMNRFLEWYADPGRKPGDSLVLDFVVEEFQSLGIEEAVVGLRMGIDEPPPILYAATGTLEDKPFIRAFFVFLYEVPSEFMQNTINGLLRESLEGLGEQA